MPYRATLPHPGWGISTAVQQYGSAVPDEVIENPVGRKSAGDFPAAGPDRLEDEAPVVAAGNKSGHVLSVGLILFTQGTRRLQLLFPPREA